jgi:hypothetical protein
MSENRGERGRFLPGCQPGPGRPRQSEKLKAYREAVRSVVTPEALAELLGHLLKRGKETYAPGAGKAAELVIRAALGKDPAAVFDLLDELEEAKAALLARQEGQALPSPPEGPGKT